MMFFSPIRVTVFWGLKTKFGGGFGWLFAVVLWRDGNENCTVLGILRMG